jgi:hypothetical protein
MGPIWPKSTSSRGLSFFSLWACLIGLGDDLTSAQAAQKPLPDAPNTRTTICSSMTRPGITSSRRQCIWQARPGTCTNVTCLPWGERFSRKRARMARSAWLGNSVAPPRNMPWSIFCRRNCRRIISCRSAATFSTTRKASVQATRHGTRRIRLRGVTGSAQAFRSVRNCVFERALDRKAYDYGRRQNQLTVASDLIFHF